MYSCKNQEKETNVTIEDTSWKQEYQAISKLGDTLYSKAPSDKILGEYRAKKVSFETDPTLENTIWLGRFTAYKGEYRKAIEIYSEGLEKFPDESRLLRHRGHRYISVRDFDKAIADLEKAAQLIEGTENKVEEDGMPNAQGIPVSTMHGNIYYHLGLAHYLAGNDREAIAAYKKCLATSPSQDNVVSAVHWLYTINCQMGNMTEAEMYLEQIDPTMSVIENEAYLKACLLYKGVLQQEDIQTSEDAASNSALSYALGNYLLCQGNKEEAKDIFKKIVAGSDWASFGYIAAEVDLATKF
jgi:tetratricopeptide (TPR) repeat protein